MNRLFIICAFAAVAFAAFVGCKEDRTTYSGPSYVMFADTLSIFPVQKSGETFGVALSATRSSDRDRTFGVEVINTQSNALYRQHYELESHTVTIKKGELAGWINIVGKYDNIEKEDSLGFALRIVALDNIEWDLYGVETKVRLEKSCPFDINNFTGYCLLSSDFFTEVDAGPRLIKSELVEGEPNTILIKGFYYDGYDIKIKLDPSDLLNPRFDMVGEQVVANTRDMFSNIIGNGLIFADDGINTTGSFNTCDNSAINYLRLYVKGKGTISTYTNIIEWISDVEAEDYM